MANDLWGKVSVAVGSLVIAAGSTLAGINAFAGRVPLVALGFVIFIGGYGLSQFGVTATAVPTRERFDGGLASFALRGILLVAGVAGIAAGVTLFAQTILTPSWQTAVLSGVSSIGGYMLAHLAVNRVGLGWTFFNRVRELAATLKGSRGG